MNLDILPIGDEIQNKNQLSDSTNSFLAETKLAKSCTVHDSFSDCI